MGRFYPKKGQYYYMVNSRFYISKAINNGGEKSKRRIKVGNCFRTYKQAQRFLNGMTSIIQPSKKFWELWK